MILPGKITLCRLEEDIPAKSFFRIRPLLIDGENGLERAEGALEQYPDEGGIRIVPDRNEVARFKTRMRTMGSYCLLDLLRHTGENDKIRPNKNYSPERGEMNRNIVYSDVITACPEGSVMEVIVPEKNEQGLWCAPEGVTVGTRRVLLKVDGVIRGPYVAERKSEEERYTFAEDAASCLSEIPESALYNFEGCAPLFITSSIIPEQPKAAEPAAAPAPVTAVEAPAEKPAEPVPAVLPAEPAKPAEAAPSTETAPVAEPAPRQEPAPKPEPAPRQEPAPRPEPAPRQEPETRRPQPRPEFRPEPERPPRQMPPREFNRSTPMPGPKGGPLNPRRSMSLAEYVDDSWKRARFEQLGAAVSPDTQATPVLSPVEKTVSAVRELMRVPEGRAALVKGLGTDIFAIPAAPAPARDTNMDELEADRLKLLNEIDSLKRNLTDTRAKLMQEAMEAHAREKARMDEEKARLNEEIEARRREADSARRTLTDAEKLLDGGARAKLDNEFLKFAMFTKAAQLLKEDPADLEDYAGIPETCNASAEQIVNDLRARFEEAGRPLTNDEAVNLLVCASVGSIVIFSGATGSGKTSLADSLAGALGLNIPGSRRYVRFGADIQNARKESAYKALTRYKDMQTQRFVLLDDANALPCPDQARGLMGVADKSVNPAFTLLMTVLDDQVGFPVDARLLDRAFTVRVKAPAFDSWRKAAGIPTATRANSLESVKNAFMNCGSVPAEVVSRMKLFCDRLKELGLNLSARTLSDMYAYCAAACPLMSTPLKALDYAIAERALPQICATAKLYQLRKLPELLCDLPEASAVLSYPMAFMPM